MKCTLNPAVAEISGRCGSLLFKTYTKADGKRETRCYVLPKKKISPDGKKIEYGYIRTAKLSDKELAARDRFKVISEKIGAMSHDEKMKYHEQWVADKYSFNGKKYVKLRGYIMARLYADNRPLSEV